MTGSSGVVGTVRWVKFLLCSRVLVAASTVLLASTHVLGVATAALLMLAGSVTAAVVALVSRRSPGRLPVRVWLVSGLLLAVMNLAGANGVNLLPVSVYAVLSLAAPVAAIALGPLYGRAFSSRLLLPLLLCVLTSFLLAFGVASAPTVPTGWLVGVLVAVVGAFTTAVWTHEQARSATSPGVDKVWAVAASMGAGAVALFAVQLAVSLPRVSDVEALGSVVSGLGLSSVVLFSGAAGVALGLANVCIIAGVSRVDPVLSLLLRPLSGLIVAAAGVVLFGERLSWWLVAAVFTAVGVSLSASYAARVAGTTSG